MGNSWTDYSRTPFFPLFWYQSSWEQASSAQLSPFEKTIQCSLSWIMSTTYQNSTNRPFTNQIISKKRNRDSVQWYHYFRFKIKRYVHYVTCVTPCVPCFPFFFLYLLNSRVFFITEKEIRVKMKVHVIPRQQQEDIAPHHDPKILSPTHNSIFKFSIPSRWPFSKFDF